MKLAEKLKLAEEKGFEEGFQKALDTKIQNMKIEPGDVIFFLGETIENPMLKRILNSLKTLGVVGLVSLAEEVDVKKMSDLQLEALGLVKKPE